MSFFLQNVFAYFWVLSSKVFLGVEVTRWLELGMHLKILFRSPDFQTGFKTLAENIDSFLFLLFAFVFICILILILILIFCFGLYWLFVCKILEQEFITQLSGGTGIRTHDLPHQTYQVILRNFHNLMK